MGGTTDRIDLWLAYRLAISEAQGKMKWYYTGDEVFGEDSF